MYQSENKHENYENQLIHDLKIVILKCEPSKIFQSKLKKKFLDVVWQYWKYLEVSPDQGGHFLSLGFLIWSSPKNFLQHKLEGYWKYEVLSEYSIPILSFIFQKSQLFSLFPTYNLIGVSYGHDFFTGAKIQPLRTFPIPRTCS